MILRLVIVVNAQHPVNAPGFLHAIQFVSAVDDHIEYIFIRFHHVYNFLNGCHRDQVILLCFVPCHVIDIYTVISHDHIADIQYLHLLCLWDKRIQRPSGRKSKTNAFSFLQFSYIGYLFRRNHLVII